MRKVEMAEGPRRYEIVPIFVRSQHQKPRVRKARSVEAIEDDSQPTPVVVPPEPVAAHKWGRDDTLRERYPRWKGGPVLLVNGQTNHSLERYVRTFAVSLVMPYETVSNLGGGMGQAEKSRSGGGMKWRVMVELAGSDGTVVTHEISTGGSNTAECSPATVGSGAGRGILPATADLLSLSVATAAQGCGRGPGVATRG
jgi:hypothetical protein